MSSSLAPTLPALPASPADELGPGGRRALAAAVLAAHLVGAWALLQVDGVREAVVEAAPLMVDWIAPPQPVPAPPPPPAPRPTPAPRPQPLVRAPALPHSPAPAFVVREPVPEPPAPAAVSAPPAPPSPPAPPAPPAQPPVPRQIPASAIQYLVPPALEVPRASRRLNEQGTVWVRLVVDIHGAPQQVSLHKSSGFARLDDQALQAMRAARFKPASDNGVPFEWTAVAPLAYELE